MLPGAFSAYRMKALQPVDYEDSQLLKEYFKSLDKSTSSQLLAKSEFSMCHAIWKSTLPDFAYECFYGSPK